MPDLRALEERFNRRIAETFANARQFVPFPATRHLPVLAPDQGLRLARLTLANPAESYTFRELCDAGCPEYTVEFLVLQDPFPALFTAEELAVARRRLGVPEPPPPEPTHEELEAAFQARLLALLDLARADFGYDAAHLRRLIAECGGIEAAREVLARPGLAGALGEFVALGRRDLSIEALVMEPRFKPVFSAWDLSLAKAHAAR
jgi:hypothetical protein